MNAYELASLCPMCGFEPETLVDYKTAGASVRNRFAKLKKEYDQALADGKDTKTWVVYGDGSTRLSHKVMDGRTIGIREKFLVGGEYMLLPSDPSASFSNTANCRCKVYYTTEGRRCEQLLENLESLYKTRNDAIRAIYEIDKKMKAILDKILDNERYNVFLNMGKSLAEAAISLAKRNLPEFFVNLGNVLIALPLARAESEKLRATDPDLPVLFSQIELNRDMIKRLDDRIKGLESQYFEIPLCDDRAIFNLPSYQWPDR